MKRTLKECLADGRLRSLLGNRSSNAFTLVEMLVVIGMLAILMGSAFSGIGQARNMARVARANAEVRQLISAWLSYEAAYDDWPSVVSGQSLDATESNLKELLGQNDGQVVYLNAQMVNGAFRDPWGTPYKFHLVKETGKEPETEDFGATVTFPNRQRVPR
jgi:prepilin-type N-terminal cleavage/methylation domain-containing protein